MDRVGSADLIAHFTFAGDGIPQAKSSGGRRAPDEQRRSRKQEGAAGMPSGKRNAEANIKQSAGRPSDQVGLCLQDSSGEVKSEHFTFARDASSVPIEKEQGGRRRFAPTVLEQPNWQPPAEVARSRRPQTNALVTQVGKALNYDLDARVPPSRPAANPSAALLPLEQPQKRRS